jgi:signal transduction histidine kinase
LTFLQRILVNLAINAIQAMPNGGMLEVAVFQKESKVCISVSDTGVGISEELKPKLFTPMVTTKAKGQGFGLAVVKRLVEAQGGRISFESEVGKGTKFIIELPFGN